MRFLAELLNDLSLFYGSRFKAKLILGAAFYGMASYPLRTWAAGWLRECSVSTIECTDIITTYDGILLTLIFAPSIYMFWKGYQRRRSK